MVFSTTPYSELDGFTFKSKLPDMKLDSYMGVQIIENLIELSKAEVVIIDPLSRFHNLDENSNTEIGKIVDIIDGFKSSRPDLAFILMHHFGKPYREHYDPLDYHHFRGAGKYISTVDQIVCFHRYDDKREWNDDGTYYDWWKLKTRVTLRHGNKIDDFVLTVNKDNNLGVTFDRWAEPRPIIVKPDPKPQEPPKQEPLDFDIII